MKHRKKKKGASLIIVLMVLAVAMIFSSVTLTTISKTTKANAQEKKSEDVLFSAESGLEYGIAWFNKNKTTGVISVPPTNGCTYDVKVEPDGSNYKIISKATINGKSKTVWVLASKASGGDGNSGGSIEIKTAAYAKEKIYLEGSCAIYGDAETSSLNAGAITATGNSNIQGNVIIPKSGSSNILNWAMNKSKPMIVKNTKEMNFTPLILPKFPDQSTLVKKSNVSLSGGETNPYFSLNGSGYYDSISIASNRTLQINTNGTDTVIRISNFEMSQGNIVINGSGKVYLYIDNIIRVKGFVNWSWQNTAKKDNLVIFCNNPSELSIDNETVINGSLYLGSASLTLANAGSITGDVATGGNFVNISGSTAASKIIYAPNAAVNLSGSVYINGAVISKSIRMVGDTKIGLGNSPMIFNPPINTGGSNDYKIIGNPKYENS